MVNIYYSIKVYNKKILTYLRNIDINTMIFCQYHIAIVFKWKKMISKYHYLTVTQYLPGPHRSENQDALTCYLSHETADIRK